MNQVKRSYVDQDTWITDKSITANLGLSPILETWANYSGEKGTKYWSRILMRFNLSGLTGSINSNDTPNPSTDTSVSAWLNIFNVRHGDTQAENFTLEVYPITTNWLEGKGLDNDSLSNTGYANAVSATNMVAWTSSGGDYAVDSNSGQQTFVHGEEDLKINITNMFNNWMNGVSANFGVIIKHTTAVENKEGSLSSFTTGFKKFFGRETNTTKEPYIQLEFDKPIKDDRDFIEFAQTGNLYFFNIVSGELRDLNGNNEFPGTVTLSANGSTILSGSGLTASRHSKGVYKVNIGTATNADGSHTCLSIPFSVSSTSAFVDSWSITSSGEEIKYNQSFVCINPNSGYSNFVSSKYRFAFKNLRNEYTRDETTRLRIHIKDDSLNLVALTAATTSVPNFIVRNGTYTIQELETGEIEVPETSLSYDKDGNFLDLDTSIFHVNHRYKIVPKFNVRGETIIIDDPSRYSFRVI